MCENENGRSGLNEIGTPQTEKRTSDDGEPQTARHRRKLNGVDLIHNPLLPRSRRWPGINNCHP